MKWLSPKPPEYLWVSRLEGATDVWPEHVIYKPDVFAIDIVCQYHKRLLQKLKGGK